MGRTGLARSLRDQLRRLSGGSLGWLLFTASTLPAAPPEYHQRSWQRADGLPDNSVRAVLQTRDGYLWVGTDAGLARFDGARFVVFNQVNVPALPKPRITALAEDTRGALWIGTEAGLVRQHRGAFEPVDLPDDSPRPFITRLCAGRDGAVWIGTKTGVHRFHAGRFTVFPGTNEVTARLVGSMCEDADGDLWLSNITGVYRWNPACTNLDVVFRHRPGKSPDLGLWADVKMVCAGGDLCFSGFGLLRRWRNGELLTCTNVFQPKGVFLTGFTADLAGNLWLALNPDGLLRFRDGRAVLFDRQSGLWVDRPQCLATDREGNLWIGTERQGLICWHPRAVRTLTSRDGLADDMVWALWEARDGTLWIGTDGGVTHAAVTAAEPDGWRWLTNYSVAQGLSHNCVRALCEDAAGALWIGTGNGLTRLANGLFTHHPLPLDRWGYKIRALHHDRTGALWVGWEHGLACLRDGRWTNYSKFTTPAFYDVRVIHQDRLGALWVGTQRDGLKCWHEGQVTTFTELDGLANARVAAVHEDADGTLWLGTEHGLVRWRDGRFTSFTTAHGLFDNLLNGILEDDGHLWLSCDRGIFRVRKADLDGVADGLARTVECVVLDEDDGMLDAETNGRKSQPPACRTRDGRLWFPTVQGVAVIDPARLLGRKVPPPPVVIEAVVAHGRDRFEAPQPAPGTHLDLAPGSGRLLEFSYTANSFLAPSKVRFKYRLHGWDQEWTEAGPRRSAFYTNLRPGQYRFQVIACNNHGVWNENGASLPVHVEPHFYQTPYFKALAGCAALGLVWVGYRRRLRVLRRIHNLETQAALATERTRVAADLHDDLGGSLTHHLHLLEQARQHLPDAPAARQCFQELSHSAGEAMNKVTNAIWATNPECDTLEHLVTHLQEEARTCLQSARIAARFDIPAGLPAAVLPGRVRQQTLLAAKEALSNIVKHAEASEVWLRMATRDGHLVVAIEDNGRGLDLPACLGNTTPGNHGQGLCNMRRRLEAIGGRFEAARAQPRGTRLVFTIPLTDGGPSGADSNSAGRAAPPPQPRGPLAGRRRLPFWPARARRSAGPPPPPP